MLPPGLVSDFVIQNIAQRGNAAFASRLTLCRTCEIRCPGFPHCLVDRVISPDLRNLHPVPRISTFHRNALQRSSDIIHLRPA